MAKHRGRGFAAIEYPTGMNQNGDPSQAWVKLKPDGRVDVFAGTVDIGQGSRTVHTQIVADTLGVPYDWVTMDNTNTDSSPVCTGSFASRGTFIGGNAVRFAAERARERVLDIASKELEVSPDDLEIEDGVVSVKGAPDRKIGVDAVAAAATYGYGELITGTGAALKPYAAVDPEDGSVTIDPHSAISYAACVADVEVDDETGEVRVERLIQVYDVGKAINPTLVEGQIDGGAMMGLGLGLLEACYPYYPSLEHRGGEFGTYLAPSVAQLPEIEYVILEHASEDGPFGAKAIGEMASNSQAPAIATAVHDAIGVWITETPITPERVLRALERRAAGEDAPRREGKRVIFDEQISVGAFASPGAAARFEVPA
ncbi:MAG: molybdopterin cofactor-binding domain-containing protein [Gaiellales bacterium]